MDGAAILSIPRDGNTVQRERVPVDTRFLLETVWSGAEEARTALLQFIIYVSKSGLRIIGTLRALSSQHYGDKDGKCVPPGLDSKTLSQRGWGGKDTEKLSNTPN